MRVTITYGSDNSLTRQFVGTIGTVLGDEDVQAALGFGDNVEGHVYGVPQANSTPLVDGMTISVHDKSCAKAS